MNWTWVFVYLLTLGVAYSLVMYTFSQPPPTMTVYEKTQAPSWQLNLYDLQGNISETETMPGKITWIPENVTDEHALEMRNNGAMTLEFWPIYLIGTIWVSVWVLKQKRRSLWWLLLYGWLSPLWLSNKNNSGRSEKPSTISIESNSIQSQTSVNEGKI